MESVNVKALVNGRKVVGGLKRKQTASATSTSHVMVSQQHNIDSFSFRCCNMMKCDNCNPRAHSLWNLHILRNYRNFTRSGLPQRVLFNQDGEWRDFSENVTSLAQGDFQMKKAISEVMHQNRKALLDFLHMVCIDAETGGSMPIAWIDIHGACFFPEFCSSYEHREFDRGNYVHMPCEPNKTQETNDHLEICAGVAESSNSEAPNEDVVSNAKRNKSVSSNTNNNNIMIDVCNDKNICAEIESFGENGKIKSISSNGSNNQSINVVSHNNNEGSPSQALASQPQENAPIFGRVPRTPTSPWMPFSLFFAEISTKISAQDMDLVNIHFEEFKRLKINRIDLVNKLKQIIGDKLMISTIMRLQHKTLNKKILDECNANKRKLPMEVRYEVPSSSCKNLHAKP